MLGSVLVCVGVISVGTTFADSRKIGPSEGSSHERPTVERKEVEKPEVDLEIHKRSEVSRIEDALARIESREAVLESRPDTATSSEYTAHVSENVNNEEAVDTLNDLKAQISAADTKEELTDLQDELTDVIAPQE